MNDYVREVSTAAEAWAGSFDQGSAGIKTADLVVQDPYDEEPSVTLHLQELVSTELRYVLECDAAARTGEGPAARSQHGPADGEVLRYVATRLDLLTSDTELASDAVDRGWPDAAADLLAEAARASEALAGLISHAVDRVTTNLFDGGLVALPTDGAKGVPNQAAMADEHRSSAQEIAEQLDGTANQLRDLSRAIAQLQHTTAATPGTRQHDGATLATEAVLECRLPGLPNTCRFHVRVFRPAGERPVVVIGDMTDNHSQSITNAVEEVAATVAELLLDDAPHDAVTWVQLYPPGKFTTIAESGQIQAVRFEEPYSKPRWRNLPDSELEQLAGGPVRIWHAKDYTVPPWHSETSRSFGPRPNAAAPGLPTPTTTGRPRRRPPPNRPPLRNPNVGGLGGDARARRPTTDLRRSAGASSTGEIRP